MSFRNQYLTPDNSLIQKKRLYGFDIETKDDNRSFLMGSIVSDDFKKVFWDRDAMIGFFKNVPIKMTFCSTNLMFDVLALFGNDHKDVPDVSMNIRNGKMISAKCGKVEMIDTLSFYPASVENLGKYLGLDKLEKPDFASRCETVEEKEYMEAYNMNDSLISYRFMIQMQKDINSFGARLKTTIASSSVDLFRRQFLNRAYKRTDQVSADFIRKAYFGGRCEAFERGNFEEAFYYDVNSLYPSVMKNNLFPDPDYRKMLKKGERCRIMDHEGFSDVVVSVPDAYYPLLPVRDRGKVIFPKGVVKGVYTHLELRNAILKGCRIISLGKQVYYDNLVSPFDEFVTFLYKKRLEYKKEGNIAELTAKILLNSLYGKWGMRDEVQIIKHIDDMRPKDFEGSRMIPNTHWMSGTRKMKPEEIPCYVIPEWSAYITAYARLKLHSLLERSEAFYCDTDSIFTFTKQPTGDGLGELKLEKEIIDGCVIRPKMYMIDGKVKLKGFHRGNMETWNDVLNGKQVHYMKYLKLRETLRKKGGYFNMPVSSPKMFGLEDDKRAWKVPFNPKIFEDSKPLLISNA